MFLACTVLLIEENSVPPDFGFREDFAYALWGIISYDPSNDRV